MEIAQVEIILSLVKKSGRKGCGVITLSKDSGISQSKIRKFVGKRDDFFLTVNGRIQLNRFGVHKGSADNMLNSYRREQVKNKGDNFWFLILIFTVVFVLIFR